MSYEQAKAAFAAGSAGFALSSSAFNRGKRIPLMDNGPYHSAEVTGDRIPALLAVKPDNKAVCTAATPTRWP